MSYIGNQGDQSTSSEVLTLANLTALPGGTGLFIRKTGTSTFENSSETGLGDVVGPASAVDSNFVAFDAITGKLIKDSGFSSSTFLKLDQTIPQTIINGKPTIQGLVFATNPTVGAFAEGKLYYDTAYKTLSCNISTDVNLQIGQEDLVRVWNATGVPITNGQVVYVVGASNGLPSVALAKADVFATSIVTGVATQTIADGAAGFITRRGEIHDIDTSAWSAGDVLYLSTATAGLLTNVVPSGSSIESRVGRVLEVNATTGEIYVDLFRTFRVTDLADATVTTPTLDQVLRYNGTEWVNGNAASSSASVGIEFFNATPEITASGANNDLQILTLSKVPVTSAEQSKTVTVGNATVPLTAWLYDTALGRTSIDAGVWDFETYASVSSTLGGRVSTITRQIYSVLPQDGAAITINIVNTAGVGAVTASGGTPFATAKATGSATNTTASYLQTPAGIYQITAIASDTTCTIACPVGKANETGVTFNVWKKLFGVTTPTITTTGTNYSNYAVSVAQAAFTVTALHKLGAISFGTSNTAGVTITTTYNGTTHNTHFSTPLITMHNNLAGLQGGSGNEMYHLTSAQATVATQAATSSVNGYLSSTDWSTFNGKGAGDMLLGTIQAVTAEKKFTNEKITLLGSSTGKTIFSSANASGTDYTYTLPARSLTIDNITTATTTNGTGFLKGNGSVISFDNSTYYKSGDSPTFATITTTGGIELGNASDCTVARVGAGQISVESIVVPTISSTNTLTNKRITKRVTTTTDDATAVIDIDTCDVYELSAVANATEFTLTGTPTDGQTLMVRIKDAGVTKGLTWTGFTAIGVTLPVATTAGKWHYVGCQYNLASTAWHAIAVGVQA